MVAAIRSLVGVGSAVMGVFYLLPQHWAIMLYLVLDEWRDGFSIGVAVKDAAYAMAGFGMGFWQDLDLQPTLEQQREVKDGDDPIRSICIMSMYTVVTEIDSMTLLMNTADPVSTAERADGYIEACRHVYESLDPSGRQRAILDSLPLQPGVPVMRQNITHPFLHGPQTDQEYEELKRRRDEAAGAMPDLAPRHQNPSEAEPAWVRESLAANGDVQPIVPEKVPASQVAEALYHGRVVQFDATEILPREVFNLTIPEIARMHGDLADEIPCYHEKGPSRLFGYNSLREVGRRIELLEKANKLYHPNAVPVPRRPDAIAKMRRNETNTKVRVDGKVAELLYNVTVQSSMQKLLDFLDTLPINSRDLGMNDLLDGIGSVLQMDSEGAMTLLHSLRVLLSQWTINVRRLPKLPDVDMKRALGNPDWVERSWGMLWTGALPVWWHLDEPDNTLIALNREITVGVFMMNDTDTINGHRGPVSAAATKYFDLAGFHPDKVSPEWLANNSWIKKFPYVRVHLKPGMGVTVPSRSYHTIWAQDSDRILLNSFLLPKYGALGHAPRPRGSFFAEGFQSKEYMALYHLKIASICRLWDTKHIGGFFEFTKLEIM